MTKSINVYVDEVTLEQKIEFWKARFPRDKYAVYEIAKWLDVSEDTVNRLLLKFETPRLKVTSTPFILQDSLVHFFICACAAQSDDETFTGLEYCIADTIRLAAMRQADKNIGKQPQTTANASRK